MNLKILVVDDHDGNRKITKRLAEKRGDAVVHTASSGKEAVEIVRKKSKDGYNYDAVLMDGHMPGMDGPTATAKICKNSLENGIDPPEIIACTSDTTQSMKEQFLESGAKQVLQKPLNSAAVMEALNNVTKK